ncbi:PREDICTED: pentatricopeptide repeat-containing protein At4g21065-like [Lupinus angustifolius]|uniref:pentatricopeptide repeat-containing protein At4g21065-like n=1 Tax=Lupinus angustifolius TaxID=3871 RepID=UPI00092F4085|nr:PREDICTED: pentatricopeptide repeat-containing protein At4g21065-like [Lupinus angustifolius]
MERVYKLHATLIKTGQHKNPHSLRSFILHCLDSSLSFPVTALYASSLFFRFPIPSDPFLYNTLIKSLMLSSPSCAFSIFTHMHRNDVPFDRFTFPLILKACVPFKSGYCLHSLVLKLGFHSNVYVQNALINAYSTCGSVHDAVKVFDEMSQWDLVSWSSLVSCFASNGLPREALGTFRRMQGVEGVKPDGVVMLSVISAVSSLGALELGIWVHGFVQRSKLGLSVALGTALIDMYSRCGSIDRSLKMFDEMPHRNVVTWTTLINGLAVHGRSREALNAFYDMRKSGLKPDHVAFLGALVACSHGGLLEDGWRVFGSMRSEYGIEPKLEHYGCMVDLLGRAGMVLEAFKFVDEMPIKPNSVIWRTLLGACVNHNHLMLAEKAKEQINKLDPHHDGDYVLLSNAYGGVGKWVERAGVRDSMRENRIIKEPGWSLVHIDQVVHEFVSGDNSHPQWEEIADFLVSVIDTLKVGGYTPNTSIVLHDVQEEEKEHCLGYHSEKLAVAYVLLYHRDRKTIRVIKNLRICFDCHNFMKHVSVVFEKEIIVRDRNRFHHFRNGSCSCRDFW